MLYLSINFMSNNAKFSQFFLVEQKTRQEWSGTTSKTRASNWSGSRISISLFWPWNNDKRLRTTVQCYSHTAFGERQGSFNASRMFTARIYIKRFGSNTGWAFVYSLPRPFVFLWALCTKNSRIMYMRDIRSGVNWYPSSTPYWYLHQSLSTSW